MTPWTICSLPGSSIHGIRQARILEWIAISFSGGFLPDPGIEPGFAALKADSLPSEPPGKPQEYWSKPIVSPRGLRDPGKESWSSTLQAGSLPAELPGKPHVLNLELL